MSRSGKNIAGRKNQVREIGSYLTALGLHLEGDYSPDQRTVFSAALAERHLAAEEASPQANREDQAVLRDALEAVWSHVLDQRLPLSEADRLQRLTAQQTAAASTARQLVQLAIACCAAEDNLTAARQAAEADIEAAVKPLPSYPETSSAREKAWMQPGVVQAVERQQALLMHASVPINEYMVDFIKNDARAEKPFKLQQAHFLIPTHPGEAVKPKSNAPVLDLSSLLGALQPGPVSDLLSSALGRLQKGILPEEILKHAAEIGNAGMVTSKTEQAHTERLETTMTSWTREQRIAFCAALAERWLPTYETFSREEEWGQPDQLKGILDAVWGQLQGRKLSRAAVQRYHRQILENTPDTEDFDDPLAMAVCEILDHSVSACLERDSLEYAVSAGIAGCSYLAMLGQGLDYRGNDPAQEEQLWQQQAVLAEIERQVALLTKIAPLNNIDSAVIEMLRTQE